MMSLSMVSFAAELMSEASAGLQIVSGAGRAGVHIRSVLRLSPAQDAQEPCPKRPQIVSGTGHTRSMSPSWIL